MRMIVDASGHGAGHIVITIPTKGLMRDIATLLSERKNADAILLALARGAVERVVPVDELGRVEADVIVTPHRVRWDVSGGRS